MGALCPPEMCPCYRQAWPLGSGRPPYPAGRIRHGHLPSIQNSCASASCCRVLPGAPFAINLQEGDQRQLRAKLEGAGRRQRRALFRIVVCFQHGLALANPNISCNITHIRPMIAHSACVGLRQLGYRQVVPWSIRLKRPFTAPPSFRKPGPIRAIRDPGVPSSALLFWPGSRFAQQG
jgi:hypothetical protein